MGERGIGNTATPRSTGPQLSSRAEAECAGKQGDDCLQQEACAPAARYTTTGCEATVPTAGLHCIAAQPIARGGGGVRRGAVPPRCVTSLPIRPGWQSSGISAASQTAARRGPAAPPPPHRVRGRRRYAPVGALPPPREPPSYRPPVASVAVALSGAHAQPPRGRRRARPCARRPPRRRPPWPRHGARRAGARHGHGPDAAPARGVTTTLRCGRRGAAIGRLGRGGPAAGRPPPPPPATPASVPPPPATTGGAAPGGAARRAAAPPCGAPVALFDGAAASRARWPAARRPRRGCATPGAVGERGRRRRGTGRRCGRARLARVLGAVRDKGRGGCVRAHADQKPAGPRQGRPKHRDA